MALLAPDDAWNLIYYGLQSYNVFSNQAGWGDESGEDVGEANS